LVKKLEMNCDEECREFRTNRCDTRNSDRKCDKPLEIKKAQQRKKKCYGELRCWGYIQARCVVRDECFFLAGGQRKVDRVQGKVSHAF